MSGIRCGGRALRAGILQAAVCNLLGKKSEMKSVTSPLLFLSRAMLLQNERVTGASLSQDSFAGSCGMQRGYATSSRDGSGRGTGPPAGVDSAEFQVNLRLLESLQDDYDLLSEDMENARQRGDQDTLEGLEEERDAVSRMISSKQRKLKSLGWVPPKEEQLPKQHGAQVQQKGVDQQQQQQIPETLDEDAGSPQRAKLQPISAVQQRQGEPSGKREEVEHLMAAEPDAASREDVEAGLEEATSEYAGPRLSTRAEDVDGFPGARTVEQTDDEPGSARWVQEQGNQAEKLQGDEEDNEWEGSEEMLQGGDEGHEWEGSEEEGDELEEGEGFDEEEEEGYVSWRDRRDAWMTARVERALGMDFESYENFLGDPNEELDAETARSLLTGQGPALMEREKWDLEGITRGELKRLNELANMDEERRERALAKEEREMREEQRREELRGQQPQSSEPPPDDERSEREKAEEEERDPEAARARRERPRTQRDVAEDKGMQVLLLEANRTATGSKTGSVLSFSGLVVVGNGNGMLGYATGKANDAKSAVRKAYEKALKNICYIPRYDDHTVHGEVTAKYGAVKVILYPKPAGTGIVASPMMHNICRLAGFSDVGVKCHGSSNKRNTVKALFSAFEKLEVLEAEMERRLGGRAGDREDRRYMPVVHRDDEVRLVTHLR